jgi:hypothetical protein
MALLPSGFRCPAQFCPVMCQCQRRKAEFQEKVAPILVPFIYGPDYYGYTSTTDFVRLSNGYLRERNILVRVVDESMYPLQWKQFVRWKEEYGLFQIAPHAIVEGDEAGWEGSKEEEELHRRRNQEIWDRLMLCYFQAK